ncbi:MAG: galactose mutarotase [Sphingobacteriales bacterium 41-5]|nr:MAG: galactose mutarotase [Sphingobacteriales bacterium 41-5]
MRLLLCLVFVIFSMNIHAQKNPQLPSAKGFDTVVNGKKISLFFIQNKNGYKAAMTNYGARMVGLIVKDKNGNWLDIVPGYNNIKPYFADRSSGATVGRFANRIAKGKFVLDGKEYKLPINNGPNTLHGGPGGFSGQVWEARQINKSTLEFTIFSKDREEGFPGNVNVKATYQLNDKNELVINYEAATDKKTVINLTNHNYWNLNGEGDGYIGGHKLQIFASKFTPTDETSIPTGMSSVKNTPFDFRKLRAIDDSINLKNQQLTNGKGYDHNYVLDKGITQKPGLAAIAAGDKSGIVLKVYTTEPGIQFYSGNFMNGKNTWKSGAKNEFRAALALETQHFPDSPNQPKFPTTVLSPGKKFKSTTIYKIE